MSIKALCVPPADIRRTWQAVSYMIVSALENGDGMTDYAVLECNLFDGHNQLWLAVDDERDNDILAAAVTTLGIANGRKICTIIACGGREMARWMKVIETIEAFAIREGCASVAIYGRRGWARALDGYREIASVMEKRLN